MNKSIQKKLITECIRGWFVLDNILFGGTPEKYLKEVKVLNNYNQTKKKFLKTCFEFYDKIGYKSSFNVLPEDSKVIQKSANVITEGLKKELSTQFKMNEKKYCKMISEGVDFRDDKLLKKRTNYLGRTLMIENFFVKKPLDFCLGNKSNTPEVKVFQNCLNECRNIMLNISAKYYDKF